MTPEIRTALLNYLEDLSSLSNESAKTHRFSALVSELFPNTTAVRDLAAGIEKIVRVTETGRKRGRIDAYYGDVVIEFERSLKATESTALDQLREYAAAIWTEQGREQRPLVCIASDGIVWKSYQPRTKKITSKPLADDIELLPLWSLSLTADTLHDFWIRLTALLFGGHGTTPTAERFRIDFGAKSAAYTSAMSALMLAWEAVRKAPEPRLAFETWQKYLTVTYGQLGTGPKSELELLFLKHTYLASTAHFMVWGALSGKTGKDGTLREIADGVLSGHLFKGLRIENLVEDDFFQWVRRPQAQKILAPVWERLLNQITSYALDQLNQDVLKGIYQELVDPKERHELGEYYTPEWLCELTVREKLPDSGYIAVLDPTCGSGSFLRAVIAHYLKENPNDPTVLQSILDNVVGIDIHPLAVIISRATYVLAIAPVVKRAKRPIQIPVYLADSLFLPAEVSQFELGGVPEYHIRFGGDRAVAIPESIVKDASLFDSAISACSEIATDHAKTGKESEATLMKYLQESVPSVAQRDDLPQVRKALWQLASEMADLIRTQRNSIWSFIIRNSYRPAMLRSRFDLIVGNPPWLAYRFIADPEYQAEVKRRAVTEYKIAPKSSKLRSTMELATVFLIHTLTTFGKPGATLTFVMPRSVINGDQHENLRLATHEASISLTEYWDFRTVTPIFGVPTCVLFAAAGSRKRMARLPILTWRGKLPARDLSLADAEPHLAKKSGVAKLIYLGNRCAYSTTPGREKPNQPSPYAGAFRQGATIVPRNIYFVKDKELTHPIDPERLYWVETDPEQAEFAKAPYKGIHMSGNVEGRFLFTTALSRHLLPFLLLDPAIIVLPAELTEGELKVFPSAHFRAKGWRNVAKWFAQAEAIWNEKRGSKSSRQSLYARLDYQKELTSQNVNARYFVLYNHSGKNLSACAIDRTAIPGPFIVDVKLYWAPCESMQEADFLAAILNASSTNDFIKPFQSLGLMGERDIHKKVLDLPIPTFDASVKSHAAIAELGRRARKQLASAVREADLQSGLARRRAFIRKSLDEVLGDIDVAVAEFLKQLLRGQD